MTLGLIVGIISIVAPSVLKGQSGNKPARNLQQSQTKATSSSTSRTSLSPTHCQDQLANFLHDEAVPGLHILCFSKEESNRLEATVYAQSIASNRQIISIDWTAAASWENTIQPMLGKHLHLPVASQTEEARWALFNERGEFVVEATTKDSGATIRDALVQQHGLVLLFESGQFSWPGVRIGFKRTVDLTLARPDQATNNTAIVLETMSLKPLVFQGYGFLSEDECHLIQELATPHMEYSEVVLMDHDQGRPATDFRTSQTMFLAPEAPTHTADQQQTLLDIDYRTASLVRMPRNHQEYAQVLRYGNGEKYDAHHDYFEPTLYQNDKATLDYIDGGRKNRMATVFWYLSDVEEGGETVFPRFGLAPDDYSYSMTDCNGGLKVKPKRGKAIIFYSLKPDGGRDEYSLHGACPVKEGVKWAANKWVWNVPMGYISG